MRKGADWVRLSRCLSYWELCYIEKALETFDPPYLTDYDKKSAQDLKEMVSAARGWQHHFLKTDRDE